MNEKNILESDAIDLLKLGETNLLRIKYLDEIETLKRQNETLKSILKGEEAENKILREKLNSFRISKYKTTSSFFSLTCNQRKRIKKDISTVIENVNKEISNYSVFIKELTIYDTDVKDKEIKVYERFSDTSSLLPKPVDLDEALYIKDLNYLADVRYSSIKQDYRAPIPSLSQIKEHRANLNSEFELNYTENRKAVFASIQAKITDHCLKFLKNVKDLSGIDCLKVKLSADGTNIGRTSGLVNFTFTLVNDTKFAKSSIGNITIGVADITENYEDMTDPIAHIMKEIKQLKTITYQEQVFEISYYFCADLKLLSICLGIYSSNSNYPCPWCHCKKDDLSKTSFSIFDGRSANKAKEFLKKKNKKNHFGYKHENLLTEIPHVKMLPDTLHLRLRVFHVLIKTLIKDLRDLDGHDGKGIVLAKHKNLNKWLEFLKNECKINAKSKQFNPNNMGGVTRDFVGDELLKIFNKINIPVDFPEVKWKNEKQELWKNLYDLDRSISANSISAEELKIKTETWMLNFIKYCGADSVTPYIHIMCNHLHEFVKLHGDISLFTLQGLEKLNDQTTLEFYRATNRHKDYLQQILNRRLRIDKFQIDHLENNKSKSKKPKNNNLDDNNAETTPMDL